MNYNVKLTLWFGALDTSSSSLRCGGVLSAYIHLRSGDYRAVGFAQGVLGISELVAALPAGFAADRYRRDTVLRAASAVGAAAALAYTAVLLGWLPGAALVAAMAMLGAYAGCYLPVLESVFAESLERGDTKMFTLRFMVQRVSSCAGSAIAAAFFLSLGNEWSEAACRRVLLAGLALMAAPLLLLWAFDDDKALPHRQRRQRWQQRREAQDAGAQQTAASAAAAAALHGFPQQQQQQQQGAEATSSRTSNCTLNGGGSPDGARGAYVPLPAAAAVDGAAQHRGAEVAGTARTRAAAAAAAATADAEAEDPDYHSCPNPHRRRYRRRRCCCCAGLRGHRSSGAAIAALITASDIIGALAAGMTVRFFALFFMRRCEIAPAQVALLSVAAPLTIAAFSAGCQRLSRRFGRVLIPLATRLLDVALLLCMASVASPASPGGRALLAGLHLARTGVANCARPLLRSLLQDHLPAAHRAKVNALDSVKTMGWSGSAALGGCAALYVPYDLLFVLVLLCFFGPREI